ncbi:metal ABC transporter solute-binding protein, Zn/Mn family [Desulfococcus sp.]|uniref:metal ABC transporter solute-binding protein, Zn/Mn family n=1 Tax=Desulfococcus sp. TaxID=2025834 RepID=UPI00359305B2
MRRSRQLFFIVIFSSCFIQTGFAADPVPVFVSILPQKYFVQQIGKDLVDVQVMVQPGASPHAYEPKPRQMADIAIARAYFAIGVSFETAWLNKISAANPGMKIVHTDDGIDKIAMAAHHGEGEHPEDRHPPEDHHDHGGVDPHIWLSPPLVKLQARAILAGLREIDPSHGGVYEANCRQFMADIDSLDARLKNLFSDQQGLRFMVFHPAWGYFARAYGLTQLAVEIEGKEPKPAQLMALIKNAKENNIRVIFVQPQFSAKSAGLVAREIGGQVVRADPLAEDWTANLLDVADKFKAALR